MAVLTQEKPREHLNLQGTTPISPLKTGLKFTGEYLRRSGNKNRISDR